MISKPNSGVGRVGRGWGYTFQNAPEIFKFFNLPLEIPEQTNLHP